MTLCRKVSYFVGMTNAAANTQQRPARNVDAIIGANVHQLMWSRQETQTLVAPAWGMDQSTLSMKLRGKRPWFASEIEAAARRYGVPISVLFRELPDLDSNQEPIVFKSHQERAGDLAHLADYQRDKIQRHREVRRQKDNGRTAA